MYILQVTSNKYTWCIIYTVSVPTEGGDKDSVTYHQFAESIKNNMALTNETDSLQVGYHSNQQECHNNQHTMVTITTWLIFNTQVTFNAFDHAGDGFIDGDKLKSVLSNLGLQFQV